ncbi:hypothetical protein SAMN04489812_1241 [Microlunatus soli]|uniref:Uncharacterized protein n=1 Tax=Microlunatus soli TaxID=630515 RepID=A0A1H1QEH2_9ACTN|nr:hypothetical protein SAMN04489812_1241 [Microlunatus soli]
MGMALPLRRGSGWTLPFGSLSRCALRSSSKLAASDACTREAAGPGQAGPASGDGLYDLNQVPVGIFDPGDQETLEPR